MHAKYGKIWQDLSQHWLSQRVVAWRHQAIAWTNFTHHQIGPVTLLSAVSREIPQPSITKISSKIIYLKLHLNLSGSDEVSHMYMKSHCYWYILHLFYPRSSYSTRTHILLDWGPDFPPVFSLFRQEGTDPSCPSITANKLREPF